MPNEAYMQNENNRILEPYPHSVMREVLDYIEKNRNIHVDIGRIPLNDKKTLDLFKKGNTEGVFGFCSPDMQKFLQQLKPNSFDDLMVLCALYGQEGMFRPAVFDMLPEYIERKTGKREIDNIHPDIEPIVSPTCGMIVYQDQVTEILSKIAGYSPEEAEKVRHMLAKRNPEKIAKLEPEFFCRCETRGYDRTATQKIWNLIIPYSELAGRKILVSIYTFTAYQFAYLKAHYKNEFCAAKTCAK